MRQYIEDREGDRARGRLIGVGVGPGDPSLLTLKAIQMLQNADYVAYPTSGAQADGSKASNLALARLDTLDFLAVFRFEEIYPQSFPCFSHLWEYINYHSTYP